MVFLQANLFPCTFRDGEDWRSNRVILNKEVISPKMLENFVPLLDEVGQDFVTRVHKKIQRGGQNKWTTDLSQELFKFALECKSDSCSTICICTISPLC